MAVTPAAVFSSMRKLVPSLQLTFVSCRVGEGGIGCCVQPRTDDAAASRDEGTRVSAVLSPLLPVRFVCVPAALSQRRYETASDPTYDLRGLVLPASCFFLPIV